MTGGWSPSSLLPDSLPNSTSIMFEFINWGTSLLELANLLHWRSDGTHYIDPANDAIMTNSLGLAKYVATHFLKLLKSVIVT